MPAGRSRFLFALLLLAMAMRVAVPTGWMPSPDGPFVLMPCPASAAPEAVVGHGHGHGEPEKVPQAGKQCDFAPLLASADLPSSVEVASPFLALERPLTTQSRRSFDSAHPAPPPPATGPPTLT